MNKFQLILSVLQASLNLEQFVISETFDILNEVTSTNSLNNYTHVNRGVQHYCAMAQKIGVPQLFSASHNSVCRRQVTTRTAFKHTTNEINSAKKRNNNKDPRPAQQTKPQVLSKGIYFTHSNNALIIKTITIT